MIAGSPTTADRVKPAAKWAVYTVFIANGFVLASWASRIPQVRDGLQVTPAGLGLILLSPAHRITHRNAAVRHGRHATR
jgi:hypothetical protein